MNTTTSGISKSVAAIEVKQTESRKKSLFENVGGTTKRSNILHRGRDGKKCELCGPGFCAISCGDAIYKRVKITQQPRLKQGVNCSQPIHVSVCMHTGLEPIKPRDKILYSLNQLVKGHNQEPKPEEITPTFRTPSRWVKIGNMKLHVGS